MAELLEDDLGRPKPQYEKPDGSGFEAWKGKDGHGNVRSDDGQIVALGSTGDADTANTVIGRLKKIVAILSTALSAAGNFKVAINEALPAGSNDIGKVIVSSSALPTGAATAAKQDSLATLVEALNAKLDGVIDGTTGAARQVLYGPNGQPIGIVGGRLQVDAQLTGSNATIDSAPVVGTKTVTTTAAELFAGASRLANRYAMIVYNESSVPVYWGPSGVTTSNGFPLLPQDSIVFQFNPTVATAIYFIAANTATIRVVELA